MSYFQTLLKRYDQLLQAEWDYWLEFVDYKRELYSYRFRHYNLFHWWALFIWVVAFYFNYSVLRFAIYALAFAFRLLFLPLRVAVERWITFLPLRRFLLFFCLFFETAGGITWLRLRFLERLDRRHARWEARKAAFLRTWGDEDNNPIVRMAERMARWDRRLRRLEKRTVGWLFHRLYRYWFRYRLPYYYRRVLHWIILTVRLLHYRSRRFYKWELAEERLLYRWEVVSTGSFWTQWASWATKVVLYFRWGFRLLCLVGRFFRALFSSTPLIGRRLRRPPAGRSQRFRISRYFPRKYSGSFREDQPPKAAGTSKEDQPPKAAGTSKEDQPPKAAGTSKEDQPPQK